MSKTFKTLGHDVLSVSSNVRIKNIDNALFYYENNISISASSTATISVSGLFFNTASAVVTTNQRGYLTILALSRALNSVKITHIPYHSYRDAGTAHSSLGTAFGTISVETNNSQTGGGNLTGVINVSTLDITLDLTDGASAVTDGELYVYVNRVF